MIIPWFCDFVTKPRVLYAVVFAWISVTGGRFMAPFLKHEAHISDVAIGMLLAVQPLVSIPCGTWAGQWADALEVRYPGRGRVQLLGAGLVLGTGAFVGHSTQRWFDDGARGGDGDGGWGDDPATMNTNLFASFAWLFFIRIVYSVSVSFIFPTMDGICLHYLNQDKQHFGKERLYGAITWAITNVCLACALDQFGFKSTYPFSLALCAISLLALYWFANANMPTEQSQRYDHVKQDNFVDSTGIEETENEQISEVTSDSQGSALTYRRLLRLLLFGRSGCLGVAFFAAVVVMSAGQALVESLVFLFFEYLGSSFTMMGLTVVLTVAFEIPIFHVADRLLERFGPSNLLQAAMLCYMIRVLGYSLIPQGHIAYVLILEPMHGVTYACSQTAIVDFVARATPKGYEASGQGVVYIFRGLGSVLVLLLGGWVEETLGPRILYRGAAGLILLGSIVLGLAGRRMAEPSHSFVQETELS